MADILFSIMWISENGHINFELCRTAINIVNITVITFVASKVCETDKMAKMTNLQNLECLLKIEKNLHLGEVLNVWKLNNSPPFTLTAWGFFNFSKGLYLHTIHIVITYSLLIIN